MTRPHVLPGRTATGRLFDTQTVARLCYSLTLPMTQPHQEPNMPQSQPQSGSSLDPVWVESVARALSDSMAEHLIGMGSSSWHLPPPNTLGALERRTLVTHKPWSLTPQGWRVWAFLQAQGYGFPALSEDAARALVTNNTLQASALYLTAARIRRYSYTGHARTLRAQGYALLLEARADALTSPDQDDHQDSASSSPGAHQVADQPASQAADQPVAQDQPCAYSSDLIGRTGITRHGEHIRATGPAIDQARVSVIPVGGIPGQVETFAPQVAHVVWDAPSQDPASQVDARTRALSDDALSALIAQWHELEGEAGAAEALSALQAERARREEASQEAPSQDPGPQEGNRVRHTFYGDLGTLERLDADGSAHVAWDVPSCASATQGTQLGTLVDDLEDITDLEHQPQEASQEDPSMSGLADGVRVLLPNWRGRTFVYGRIVRIADGYAWITFENPATADERGELRVALGKCVRAMDIRSQSKPADQGDQDQPQPQSSPSLGDVVLGIDLTDRRILGTVERMHPSGIYVRTISAQGAMPAGRSVYIDGSSPWANLGAGPVLDPRHADDCPVRADFERLCSHTWAHIAQGIDPATTGAIGALIEYGPGGDQEGDVCTCGAIDDHQEEETTTTDQVNAETFAHYLRTTLIPDLRESGLDATADDFETCIGLMEEASKPKPAAQPHQLVNGAAGFGRGSDGQGIALDDLSHISEWAAARMLGGDLEPYPDPTPHYEHARAFNAVRELQSYLSACPLASRDDLSHDLRTEPRAVHIFS